MCLGFFEALEISHRFSIIQASPQIPEFACAPDKRLYVKKVSLHFHGVNNLNGFKCVTFFLNLIMSGFSSMNLQVLVGHQ